VEEANREFNKGYVQQDDEWMAHLKKEAKELEQKRKKEEEEEGNDQPSSIFSPPPPPKAKKAEKRKREIEMPADAITDRRRRKKNQLNQHMFGE
jgi:hypothetical protein